ncbi:arsenate reductase (glutaredoxin) [Aestuariivivens sp. NBU2969]|uniref:arsenate reductase (glutaredoxin) n=1 Tax=Aestuariivivens sp. NBU2969 TaxID=2873267 RepID=UPI001CC070A7|nr:arsenate reductase (glutaredoxin) [Aestuariivivens sp. NBU2969]
MITIYHNPRCTKSRQGLEIVENSDKPFQIIKYLDEKLSTKQLNIIVKALGIKPIELVRKNETIWKENFKGKDLSDIEIINAMVANPKLIERPIVINGNKAVIGRPPERIFSII